VQWRDVDGSTFSLWRHSASSFAGLAVAWWALRPGLDAADPAPSGPGATVPAATVPAATVPAATVRLDALADQNTLVTEDRV
jgi:hypothetical protein